MIKKVVYIVLFHLFSFSLVFSQGNDTVVKLRLRKKNANIIIKSDSNVLYRWRTPNKVIVFSDNPKIPVAHVRGQNMEVKKISKNKYQLFPVYSDTLNYQGGKLKVYCKNKRGKIKLHTIKEFKFIDPIMPKVSIAGIGNDSVIKRDLLVSSHLNANYNGVNCKILAYNLIYMDDDGEQSIIEYSGRFPIHVRNAFRKLSAGSTIKFQDIKILLPNGELETVRLQTYFVDL